MPEGPEVRLTTELLNRKLKGCTITSWVFCGGKYTDEYPKGYLEFDSILPITVESIDCKGKFIYFTLVNNDSKIYVLHSLMMTGRWQNNYDDYCKWYLEYTKDGGSEEKTIWFRDPRSFGTLLFSSNKDILDKKLSCLGPDIMRSDDFKLPLFIELCSKYPNKNICAFLMDQSIISGVGNYIKAEVLYDAAISPKRKMNTLSNEEIEYLYQALCVIPRVSYNNKGLSIKDYSDENGRKGMNTRNLKVYGDKTKTRTKTADGRVTYWDPNVQK